LVDISLTVSPIKNAQGRIIGASKIARDITERPPAEQNLPNGEIWRNITTEAKCEVAHTLQQFRGNYQYNMLDENFALFMRRWRCSRSGTTMR
jgi:hypothetical protein